MEDDFLDNVATEQMSEDSIKGIVTCIHQI